jgi:hypothetical protein
LARTSWGASAAHSAIAASDRAPASTAAAAMARMATKGCGGRGPLAGQDGGEVGQQVQGVGVLDFARVGMGEGGQGAWDRG